MKICISTIIDYNNYGNRLQNYALQTVLEKFGFEVVTLKNIASNDKKNFLKRIFDSVYSGRLIKKIFEYINPKIPKAITLKKNDNFLFFTKEYIKETDFFIDEKTTNFDFEKDFDFFIVGSDQVWNPFFSRFSELDFVPYVPKKKRISYAASFGVSSIPDELNSLYSRGLKEMNAISVREKSGVDIVKKLINKDVPIVLDPTLLLKKEEWRNLISQEKSEEEKYILTYFLGTPTEFEKEYIYGYSKKNNLKIKCLNDLSDLDTWISGPKEFIQLFAEASIVFTDSFHGCVFSLIFEKAFIAFERHDNFSSLNSMSSRIDTLLEIFSLNSQKFNVNELVYDVNIDYCHVNKILENERNYSLNVLGSFFDAQHSYSKS